MENPLPLAVITGASRGLGYETARQLGKLSYRLVLTARDKTRLFDAGRRLAAEGFDVAARPVDMGSARSIASFAKWLATRGPIDALVNCAGISGEDSAGEDEAARDKAVVDTIMVNTIGPWRLTRAVIPLLTDNARIVNVSSGMGALTDMGTGYFGYRASKAGLNVLTRTLAQELAPRGIKVNSVCPGWVKTDMGGPNATRDVEHGVSGIVWAATLPPAGPTNGFFRDGRPIPW